MKTWTARMKGHDISATSGQLDQYRRAYVSDPDLLSRMSELLWFDIYVLDQEFGVSPHDVLSSIDDLEKGEPGNGVKPATEFKKQPLKGLWHKHYFSAHFVPQNITLGLGKDGLKKLVDEVFDESKSPVVTPEMISELAHRVTHEPLENRESQGRLTGEWIVFIKHAGKNYYLCLNTHGAGDQFVYDRIAEHCIKDFPDLIKWKDASA